jgi:hypothetical protein
MAGVIVVSKVFPPGERVTLTHVADESVLRPEGGEKIEERVVDANGDVGFDGLEAGERYFVSGHIAGNPTDVRATAVELGEAPVLAQPSVTPEAATVGTQETKTTTAPPAAQPELASGLPASIPGASGSVGVEAPGEGPVVGGGHAVPVSAPAPPAAPAGEVAPATVPIEQAARSMYLPDPASTIEPTTWTATGAQTPEGKPLYYYAGDTQPGHQHGATEPGWTLYDGPHEPVPAAAPAPGAAPATEAAPAAPAAAEQGATAAPAPAETTPAAPAAPAEATIEVEAAAAPAPAEPEPGAGSPPSTPPAA